MKSKDKKIFDDIDILRRINYLADRKSTDEAISEFEKNYRWLTVSGLICYAKLLLVCRSDHPDSIRKSLYLLRRAYRQGSAWAAYELGVLYDLGNYVPYRPKYAHSLFCLAAANNIASALRLIGTEKLYGSKYERKNVKQGLVMLAEAAHEGDFLAAKFLADEYQAGEYAFPLDKRQAKKWRKLWKNPKKDAPEIVSG
jgi:TPR repeat protein